MNRVRIVPYDSTRRDEVVAVTLAAWTPVFAKTMSEVPRFAYDAFYPKGWEARQSADVQALLESEPQNIWLAMADGEVAGFAGIRLHPEDRMGEIFILAVSPHRQRQGIGRMLMDHAEAIIRTAGMTMVMVETIDDTGHEPARRAYEASNYVRWPVARYFKELK
jgi:ribosomal protein S18 acetylase RimI-like enzyme